VIVTRYLPWGLIAASGVLVAARAVRCSARAARQAPVPPAPGSPLAPVVTAAATLPAPRPRPSACPLPGNDEVLALADGEDAWW
jgi:hypothetical protein